MPSSFAFGQGRVAPPFGSKQHRSSAVIVVVLSPHRDDAAFSMGLAIETWLAAGHTVSVLNCFTQSEYAPYSDVEALHQNDRVSYVSALRKREDLSWNKLLGSKLSFHDLDLLDAPLRLACAVDEVLTVDVRPGDRALARIQGAIAKMVRKGETTPLAVFAPLAVGGHIDHRLVNQAVVQQLAQAAFPVGFYEDLPYAAREGGTAEIVTRVSETGQQLTAGFAGEPQLDASSAVRRKLRAADCYDSQIDSEVGRSLAEFSTQYGGRERLWANAAMGGSGLLLPVEGEAS